MKMVLEDRIRLVNLSDDLAPLFETLTLINDTHRPDFKVSIVMQGFVVINGTIYGREDSLILVKEKDIPLFAIYRNKITDIFQLSWNQYGMMSQKERDFHDHIASILEER